MSSHVVVLDSTARRAVIKTTPTKHLSDVLQEACGKLGLDPSKHGLKNSSNKTLDLSQPIRLSGLSSGAKLQLVVLSRSPSVVSVALQLPESEANGQSRLTDKFPSSTTLWLLLRHFESTSQVARNFTARGTAKMGAGASSGAGRMYYETPVIHAMGRELSSFTDLQKTLAQLGFNSGSVLLRLSFRGTETPLEEAMTQIDQYFKSAEGDSMGGAHAGSVATTQIPPNTSEDEPILTGENTADPAPADALSPPPDGPLSPGSTRSETIPPPSETDASLPNPSAIEESPITGPSQRPMIVYAPPSVSTPAAARQAHNEKDYEPTIDHAKLHQQRLATYARNKTLPSDAELAAQAEAQAKKNAEVKEVRIKIRFPDQSQVVSTFTNLDTTATLYEFVQRLMRNENEPFSLNFSTPKGPQNIPKENMRLIQGLGMVGAVLVNVIWEEGASKEARGGKILKSVYEEKAEEITVKEPQGVEVEEKQESQGGTADQNRKSEGKEKKGGVPKWLKLPGKK